jgi:hypothetical protein
MQLPVHCTPPSSHCIAGVGVFYRNKIHCSHISAQQCVRKGASVGKHEMMSPGNCLTWNSLVWFVMSFYRMPPLLQGSQPSHQLPKNLLCIAKSGLVRRICDVVFFFLFFLFACFSFIPFPSPNLFRSFRRRYMKTTQGRRR